MKKLFFRLSRTLKGIHRVSTWKALNILRYGAVSRHLIFPSICGQSDKSIYADVYIAHFGPAGVTAINLRELGVISGKIVTFFHGNDISSCDVLSRFASGYQKLFRVMTPTY